MKQQWIFGLLFFLSATVGYSQAVEVDDFNALAPEDKELLKNVVELVDAGMSQAVMPDFDLLLKKYPRNYIVQYERLYNLYILGRYDEVIKDGKSLLKNKFANERTYQLIGNSYDLSGDRKKAAKIYKDGLKRFPESGSLYLELGNLSLFDNDYDEALKCYNKGILAQPDFASNYYRASMLYFSSEWGKVWGLVYAESEILLAPSNKDRHVEMGQMIFECLKDNIEMNPDAQDSLKVTLVPSRGMNIDSKTGVVYLAFPGIYEGAIMQPLAKMLFEKTPFTGSISQLIEIRKGLVESYFSVTDNIYGSSMYLLEFQKQVIEAGHWEAYNYFIFMHTSPEEFGNGIKS